MRSISRASRSAVSMRASTCPARTVSPSRTVIWRTSPDTLALTVAWLTGCSAPDTGSQRASGCGSTRVRSAGANSSVDRGLLAVGRRAVGALLGDAHGDGAADGPAITSTTTAPITRRRVSFWIIRSPAGGVRPPARAWTRSEMTAAAGAGQAAARRHCPIGCGGRTVRIRKIAKTRPDARVATSAVRRTAAPGDGRQPARGASQRPARTAGRRAIDSSQARRIISAFRIFCAISPISARLPPPEDFMNMTRKLGLTMRRRRADNRLRLRQGRTEEGRSAEGARGARRGSRRRQDRPCRPADRRHRPPRQGRRERRAPRGRRSQRARTSRSAARRSSSS